MSERSEGINFAGVVTWYTGRQREACTVQPLESVTEAFKEGRGGKKRKKRQKKDEQDIDGNAFKAQALEWLKACAGLA